MMIVTIVLRNGPETVVWHSAPGELTDEQWAITEHQAGPALVLADVGSGKTLVLAERAAAALRQRRDPATMLALTFTNRAAREMRARLRDVVGADADEVGVGTFHAFCVRVLRRDGKPLGVEPHFVIWDEVERAQAVGAVHAERGRGVDQRTLKACVEWIGRTKAEGYLPQTLPAERQDDRWAPHFRRYQRLLADSRALDYDDLIVQTWTLFRQFPAIRRRWAERCAWVEVDEGQDTAPLEYDILRDLTTEHRNLCLFGDLRQAIYGWRGVHAARIVADFRADFPEHLALPLTRNFRAVPPLQAVARSILVGGWADAPPSAPLAEVELRACADEAAEWRWIAERVVAERERGTPWSGIAVLARTNAQLPPLVEALALADIPLATVATRERFRQPAVKDLAAYLRLVLDPRDAVALRRVVNTPDRGLPPDLIAAVERAGAPVGLALADLADEGALADGEPCAYALAVVGREWVAIDTETTGLDVARDEPIALGAVLVDGRTGAQRRTFARLVRPTGPIGAATLLHGLTAARLHEAGEDPATALAWRSARLSGWRPLVGHNLDAYNILLLNGALGCRRPLPPAQPHGRHAPPRPARARPRPPPPACGRAGVRRGQPAHPRGPGRRPGGRRTASPSSPGCSRTPRRPRRRSWGGTRRGSGRSPGCWGTGRRGRRACRSATCSPPWRARAGTYAPSTGGRETRRRRPRHSTSCACSRPRATIGSPRTRGCAATWSS